MGCSSSPNNSKKDGGDASGAAGHNDGAAGAQGGASGADAGGAGSGSAGADAAIDLALDVAADGPGDAAGDATAEVAAPTSYTLKTTTFTVAKGSESTQCMELDIGNAQAIHVGHIKVTLGAPVYEVRIGATTGGVQATPTSCTPFSDIQDASVRPLVYARNDIEDLSFPAGVGYTLAAHQLLRVEVHAWNPTNDDLPANVSAIFSVSSDADFQHEAGLLLVENFGVNISVGATVQLGPQFFPLGGTLGTASIFRLEGYTHELGTDLRMGLATTSTDTAPTSIYMPAPWNPTNPLVVDEAPPLTVPAAGGIDLTCSWNNSNGSISVARGPSVHDERCAAFVSYYPAVNAHLCAHVGSVTACQ